MIQRKKFKRVVPDEINVNTLTVLEVTCGTTKCNDGYHCYSQKKTSLRKFGSERVCKECGEDLIDWERVHRNNLQDSDFIFNQLKTEIIRHVFWHTTIEDDAIKKALMDGKIKTRDRARKFVKSRIGKHTAWDGRQTPMGKDEIINYAQHATATCCRKCLEAWHNINIEDELNDSRIDFCTDLIIKYVEQRLPELKDEGISENDAEKILRNEYHKH